MNSQAQTKDTQEAEDDRDKAQTTNPLTTNPLTTNPHNSKGNHSKTKPKRKKTKQPKDLDTDPSKTQKKTSESRQK